MRVRTGMVFALCAGMILGVSGCGRIGNLIGGPDGEIAEALERDGAPDTVLDDPVNRESRRQRGNLEAQSATRTSFLDLFGNRDDPNVTLEVNRYIWNAALDVLDFLPIQSADPFSGVLVFGYGTPPGGGRAYRATVFVQDPALDARSLRVALAARGGTVPDETTRAIEDAILTRARQLRIADNKL